MFCFGHRIKMQCAVGREKPQREGTVSASSIGVKTVNVFKCIAMNKEGSDQLLTISTNDESSGNWLSWAAKEDWSPKNRPPW